MFHWHKNYEKFGIDPYWYFIYIPIIDEYHLIHTWDNEVFYWNFESQWMRFVLLEYKIVKDLGQMPDDHPALEHYV